jgi:hypothetical protein
MTPRSPDPHAICLRAPVNSAAWGHVDIRTPLYILFQISLRVESRDYYAVNAAKYGLSRRQQGQQNTGQGNRHPGLSQPMKINSWMRP